MAHHQRTLVHHGFRVQLKQHVLHLLVAAVNVVALVVVVVVVDVSVVVYVVAMKHQTTFYC